MTNKTQLGFLDDKTCFEIVRKKLLEDSIDKFTLESYKIVPLDATTGYMGQYFTLKTTVACESNPLDKKLINFFTKIPPPSNSPQSEWNDEHGSFKKEVDLYTEVFPEVLQNLDKCIPECFLAVKNDIIVLEDMTHHGYIMPDKFLPFDLEHCRVVMKTLGRFHAQSLIFEELCAKNLHEEFSHCMHETLWPLKEGRGKKMLTAAVKGIISMIDLIEGLDEAGRIKLKNKIMTLTTDHAKNLVPSTRFRNVICHGDLWANNILFKYDHTGLPTSCCFIDFQLARYNPPAHDILTFLQFTTTRKLRNDCGLELIKIYHASLSETLIRAGLDNGAILPWQELLSSVEELRTMCMVHGVLNIPIMLLESEAVSKYFTKQPELLETVLYVDRTPLVCRQFQNVERYKQRMQDALLELKDLKM